MELTKDECEKLEQARRTFRVDQLTEDQMEFLLGRKITVQKPIPYWATDEGVEKRKIRKQKKIQQNTYSIKHLFETPEKNRGLSADEIKRLQNIKSLLATNKLTRKFVEWELSRKLTDNDWGNYNKPKYNFDRQEIARQAAKKARRWQSQKHEPETYRIANIFRDNSNKYNVIKVGEHYNNKYKTTRSQWKVTGDVDLFELHTVIRQLIDKMTESLSENIKLQVSLTNSQNDHVIQTKLLTKQQMTNNLSDWVYFFIDYQDMNIEDITFKLMSIELPKGEGRRVNAIINVDSKRSIIQVKNYDTICLARAIVVGLAANSIANFQDIFKNNMTEKEMNEINKRRQTKSQINTGILSENEKTYLVDGRMLQTVLAQALHRICNIPIKAEGNDLQDVKLFEDKLNIEIQIYNLEARQIYKRTEMPTKIYLLLSQNHYDVISNMPGFTCKNESHHSSEDKKCKACKESTKCDTTAKTLSCTKCKKHYYGQTCLANHIKNKRCIEHSYMCEKCFRFFETKDLKPELHKCTEFLCKNCKFWKPSDHQCYMKRKDLKDSSEKYIFYDFETKLATNNKHEVNYCVVQYYNGDERVFRTLDEFCSWVFDKKHRGYTVVAHYGKGYDFQFVAEWLIARAVKPNIIHNGQKILQLEVKRDYNIRFIDSISFTLMPLKDFPKTFGLNELAKGYFPHKFNKDGNQDYVGNYPCKQDYGYDEMRKCDMEKFDEWYETTAGKVFNFKEEMYKYCKSDVDILRRGCIEYRNLFMQTARIDPFQYITLASVCQAIYRKEFLPENTIAIHRETPTDNYSVKAIKWLKYISAKEKLNIRHACNGGEVAISAKGRRHKVDGYCEETKTIYQFHGCYFHGCKACYDELAINKVSQYNMKYLYKRTKSIEKVLQDEGFTIVTIWEHDFDRNKEMRATAIDEYDLVETPKIRDCFYGGRCEPVKLIYDFQKK